MRTKKELLKCMSDEIDKLEENGFVVERYYFYVKAKPKVNKNAK